MCVYCTDAPACDHERARVQPVAACTARSAGTPLLPSRGARLRLRARECSLAGRSRSHPNHNRRRSESQDRSPGGAQAAAGIGDPAPGCPRRSGLTKKAVRSPRAPARAAGPSEELLTERTQENERFRAEIGRLGELAAENTFLPRT